MYRYIYYLLLSSIAGPLPAGEVPSQRFKDDVPLAVPGYHLTFGKECTEALGALLKFFKIN